MQDLKYNLYGNHQENSYIHENEKEFKQITQENKIDN